MNHILLITHGQLGKVFLEVAEAMLSRPLEVQALSFMDLQDADAFAKEVENQMQSYPKEDCILILTDLFGGTPSNLAIPYLEKDRIEVITGLNLGMIMHLLSQEEEKSFAQLCLCAKKAGSDAVIQAGAFL